MKIHSAGELYERAEQLEEKIEMYGRVSPMTEQRQDALCAARKTLSRLSELIKVYETVVKGNFIDNLIKAENERKAAEQRAAEQRKAAAERKAVNRPQAPEQPKSQQNKPKKHGRR